MAANGYPAIGYDASVGLLEECRKRHPGLRFEHSVLPELLGVEPATFDNVLCETVLMHLPLAAIPFAASRLSSILRIGGVCYLSWRVTTGQGARDARGRLYTSFPADVVTTNLERIEVLDEFERTSDSSGELVHVVVGRKSA